MSTQFSDEQLAFLSKMAEQYIWWKSAEEAMEQPSRVVAQVMELGSTEDVITLIKKFQESEFVDVLAGAESGWFTPKSWNFWHIHCGLETPPLPERQIEGEI